MANSALHSQLQPVYGAAYNLAVAFRKSDGTSLAPADLDTEVSLDGGTYADATNEVVLDKEVGGVTDAATGYITLTAAEMTADSVRVQIKSSNCVALLEVINPIRLVPVRANTAQAGAAGSITLDASASSEDNAYRGMIVRADGGTGAGQARLVTGYTGSTKVATVAPNWETTPGADTTFTVGVLPTQGGLVAANATQLGGQAVTAAAPVTVPANIGTSTLAAGAQMDLVDAPNATAVAAIQAGLSTLGAQDVANAMKTAPAAGDPVAGSVQKRLLDIEADTAEIGAAGAGLTALAPAATALSTATWTAPRAAGLDAVTEARLAELDAANLPADVAAILVDTGTDGVVVAAASKTGYALSTAGVQALWDALTSALTTVGSVGKRIVDYLDVAVSTRSTAGTGGNPVTITLVDTLAAPVPGLIVVAWNSAITARLGYGTTNASGQVVLNLDAGDIKIAVTTTAAWVAVAATAYTVTGAGAQSVPNIALTAQSVTPPAGASQMTCILDTYDAQGALEASVPVTIELTKGPRTAGQSHDTGQITATSNGSGRVSVALTMGATYRARRGSTGAWVAFLVPTTGTSYTLPEVLGTP